MQKDCPLSLLRGPNIRGSSSTPRPQSSYQLLPESEIILPCVQHVTQFASLGIMYSRKTHDIVNGKSPFWELHNILSGMYRSLFIHPPPVWFPPRMFLYCSFCEQCHKEFRSVEPVMWCYFGLGGHFSVNMHSLNRHCRITWQFHRQCIEELLHS